MTLLLTLTINDTFSRCHFLNDVGFPAVAFYNTCKRGRKNVSSRKQTNELFITETQLNKRINFQSFLL